MHSSRTAITRRSLSCQKCSVWEQRRWGIWGKRKDEKRVDALVENSHHSPQPVVPEVLGVGAEAMGHLGQAEGRKESRCTRREQPSLAAACRARSARCGSRGDGAFGASGRTK